MMIDSCHRAEMMIDSCHSISISFCTRLALHQLNIIAYFVTFLSILQFTLDYIIILIIIIIIILII